MKKEIVIVVAAIIMLSVLTVLPVMSGNETAGNASKTNVDSFRMVMGKVLRSHSEIENTAPVKSESEAENATTVKKTKDDIRAELPVEIATTDVHLTDKIAFISAKKGDDLEIYVMNADGTNVVQLTHNTVNDWTPDWSPDGSKIAFYSDRDGDLEIYVMNADGTNVVQLTHNTAGDVAPAWSPDGSMIAFHSDRDGDYEIYVMAADGTNVVQLTNNTAGEQKPAWSPDGSKVAFHSDRDGDCDIYVMDADGTNVVQLTHNTAGDFWPAWSPDGSKIAFYSDRDSDLEIYVMNADGTNVVQLTHNTVDDWTPDWSPDGSKIAFGSVMDGDSLRIYVMNADGTNVVKFTSNTVLDLTPDWCCATTPKATVSIKSTSAPKGSTVTVPIRITNVTNFGTANIWLSYNKDVVIVKGVVYQGEMTIIIPEIDNTVGVTKMSCSSTTGKTGDFVFAYVKLKAVGNAGQSSSLYLDIKELTDTSANTIPHTVTDGTFEVNSTLMEGDVTMDEHVTMADAMFIAQYKAGLRSLNASQLKCADTTDDGDVTMADAMHIAQWKVDPDSTLGVLFKPLWESPADDGMLEPVDC